MERPLRTRKRPLRLRRRVGRLWVETGPMTLIVKVIAVITRQLSWRGSSIANGPVGDTHQQALGRVGENADPLCQREKVGEMKGAIVVAIVPFVSGH